MKLLSSIALAAIAILFFGCTSTNSKMAEATSSDYYAEHLKDGRYYVIGNKETENKFKTTHHLPYTDTRIGEGPKGETVIVEIAKDNPELQKRLWKTFKAKHLFYSEVAHDGRTYVIGSAATAEKFKKFPHLPYAQTMIGAGSKGETVVVEIDKKNAALQRRLWNTYKTKHLYYAEEEHDGRIYVISSKETHAKFKKSPHLPYTKTMIGAGPGGETIIFEITKDNPSSVRRLIAEFNQRYQTSL